MEPQRQGAAAMSDLARLRIWDDPAIRDSLSGKFDTASPPPMQKQPSYRSRREAEDEVADVGEPRPFQPGQQVLGIEGAPDRPQVH